MKLCRRCNETKPLDLFTKNVAKKDGLQAYCIECSRAYRREHYYSHKKDHYHRNKVTHARLRNRLLMEKCKPCVKCGVQYPSEPWLMEFNHRNPLDKEFTIGRLLSYGSWKRVEEELSKCDLLCVVCHRRETAKMFRWQENRLEYLLTGLV